MIALRKGLGLQEMWLEQWWAAGHKAHTGLCAVPRRRWLRRDYQKVRYLVPRAVTPRLWAPICVNGKCAQFVHLVLTQEESLLTLTPKCAQFVRLALTRGESLLTISTPEHSVILNRAVWDGSQGKIHTHKGSVPLQIA